MDYEYITKQYYSAWLGLDMDTVTSGMKFVYSKERNRVQAGHGNPYDLWIWHDDSKRIISYGDRVKDEVFALEPLFSLDKNTSELIAALKEKYACHISHGIKYVYKGNEPEKIGVKGKGLRTKNNSSCQVQALTEKDYPLYESFFRKCNPNCKDISWLKDYFTDMVKEKLCCGVIVNGTLVSCTDAPEVSYMKDSVQEIGINTLQEYRGQNYATECCKLCIEKILQKGKTPLWSTSISNIASQKVAEHVGVLKFGEYIGMTLSE